MRHISVGWSASADLETESITVEADGKPTEKGNVCHVAQLPQNHLRNSLGLCFSFYADKRCGFMSSTGVFI